MYRPYTKDPFSIAALGRKTKKELSAAKKGYEEEIKKINKVFSQKDYDLNKKKKEKIHEVEKAFKSLKEEFNKLMNEFPLLRKKTERKKEENIIPDGLNRYDHMISQIS